MASMKISGNGSVTVGGESYDVGYTLTRSTGASGTTIVGVLKGDPDEFCAIADVGIGFLTLETGEKSEVVFPHLDVGSDTLPVAVAGPFR